MIFAKYKNVRVQVLEYGHFSNNNFLYKIEKNRIEILG